jgi:uncharacterized protein (TIGR03083 family)
VIPDLDTTLSIIKREGRLLIDTCEAAPDAHVTACPGWTNTDLAIHTTGVHRRVAHWCANRLTKPERWPDHEPADASAPWEWCREGLDLVLAVLRDIGPNEAVWSWTDRKDGGFYHRRMLHETVIHRWDAQDATGEAAHIDREVAADGINELIEVGMRFRGDGSPVEYPEGDLLLECTDGAHRWRLRAMDGTLLVARGLDVGDQAAATVSGPAEELLLYLWGRRIPTLAIGGDIDVADSWSRIAP